MPEQIKKIKYFKNKVPIYMIMRDYHIHKEHVYNIWNNCKRLQQSKKYELAEILSIDKKAKLHIPNLSSIYKSIYLNKSQDK